MDHRQGFFYELYYNMGVLGSLGLLLIFNQSSLPALMVWMMLFVVSAGTVISRRLKMDSSRFVFHSFKFEVPVAENHQSIFAPKETFAKLITIVSQVAIFAAAIYFFVHFFKQELELLIRIYTTFTTIFVSNSLIRAFEYMKYPSEIIPASNKLFVSSSIGWDQATSFELTKAYEQGVLVEILGGYGDRDNEMEEFKLPIGDPEAGEKFFETLKSRFENVTEMDSEKVFPNYDSKRGRDMTK